VSLEKQDAITLARSMIRAISLSGIHDPGAQAALEEFLAPLGFDCQRLPFSEDGTYPVDNLFAIFGQGGRHFCFAGHTDVVPPGDGWTHDPFGAEVIDGILYGRGAVDMKTSIAAFAIAARDFVSRFPKFAGRISFLITGDEEYRAINGTRKLVPWLREHGQIPDICLIGEPTSRVTLGDEIKIGRRGTLSAEIKVSGTQGHVAYPGHADNPVTKLISILHSLQSHKLDDGTQFFEPSNLEIVNIHVDNQSRNIIPREASATLNIRFNDQHSNPGLRAWIEDECQKTAEDFAVTYYGDDNAFLNTDDEFSALLKRAVQDVTGKEPALTTGGGTSDARFIKDLCPTIEFGPCSATAHKADECIRVDEIEKLTQVYRRALELYFQDAQN